MRLRVSVDWAGDRVEDRVHDTHELRVGPSAHTNTAHVTVPGEPSAAIRFVEVGALVLAEIPAALVAAIEWPSGEHELVEEDQGFALTGARRMGRLVLRDAPLPEHPTTVGFALEPSIPRRRDVAIVAWAAGALSLAVYLGASIAAVQSGASSELAGPHALGAGEARTLRVSLIVDTNAPLAPLDDHRTGAGGLARRSGSALERDGVPSASRYAALLVDGFSRYLASDLDSAEARWTEASEVLPDRPEAWVNLAQVAKRRGSIEGEQQLLTRALASSPEHCEALVNLGLVEARLKAFATGHAVLARAHQACGARAGFMLLDEAALSAAEGDHKLALHHLEEAVTALLADEADKRREALSDLEHDPLFTAVRATQRFHAAVERLKQTLSTTEPV